MRKVKLAQAITENFERVTQHCFNHVPNQFEVKVIKGVALAKKLEIIKTLSPEVKKANLIEKMREIDFKADLDEIKTQLPRVQINTTLSSQTIMQILQTIEEKTSSNETKLIRTSDLYAPFTAKFTNSQLNALLAFIEATTAAKTQYCLSLTPTIKSKWEKLFLVAATVLALPGLIASSSVIGPLGEAWMQKKAILANITTPCGGETCADHYVATSSYSRRCDQKGSDSGGPHPLHDASFLSLNNEDCNKGIIYICQAGCDALETAALNWTGALNGIIIASLLLIALALWISRKGRHYIHPSEDLFNSSGIKQLSSHCIRLAERMFAECKNIPSFEGINIESPIGEVVKQAKNEALRMRLKLFGNSKDDHTVNIIAPVTRSTTTTSSLRTPLLAESEVELSSLKNSFH